MKKALLSILFFVMFIPVFVMAETCDTDKITIESINVTNSTGNASEKSNATVENKNINLDLSMHDVDDSITYKMVVKNDSSEDFEMDKNTLNSNSDYIKYTFSEGDDSVIVKAKSTKDVYLKIEYENEVPVSAYNNGTYSAEKTVAINLSTKDSIINPPTGVKNVILILLTALTISMVLYVLLRDNPYLKPFVILIGLVIIPISIHAACKCDIVVNSNVEIKKIAEFDTGRNMNYNMQLLVNNEKYRITAFKRSNTLPNDIKTLAENEILEAANANVTEQELNDELDYINNNHWVMNDFSTKVIDGVTYYCTDNEIYCENENDMKGWLISDFTYLFEENNHYKYLTYIESIDEIRILTEEEFLVRLREYLLIEKKKEILKNVFSSEKSDYLIYGWYDEDTDEILYYCENEEVYLNKDSSEMFYRFDSINNITGLNNVNTSNVVIMRGMFSFAGEYSETFEMDLSSWDTHNVVDMSGMFNENGYESTTWNIGNLDNWNTSKVTNMNGMFSNSGKSATNWNIGNLSNWDTSNVMDMCYMFNSAGRSASTFRLDLSSWDTHNVVDMSGMFSSSGEGSTEWSIGDISNWNTSKVESMDDMFESAGQNSSTFVLDLSSWDTSKVTNMNGMFRRAGKEATVWSIGDISGWDTSKVTYTSYMFFDAGYNTNNLTFDLTSWDTSKVVNMEYMFCDFGYNSNNVKLDVSNWDTSKVTDMKYIFNSMGYNSNNVELKATGLTFNLNNWRSTLFNKIGYNAETVKIDLSNWDLSETTEIWGGLFSDIGVNATKLDLDVSNWNMPYVTNMRETFVDFGSNVSELKLDVSNWNMPSVNNTYDAFRRVGKDSNICSIIGLPTWNTSSVTDMGSMFYETCNSAETFDIGDLSSWDTSKVTSMISMFYGAGQNATTWNSIGTLDVYSLNINHLFNSVSGAKVTINIHNKPTSYYYTFSNAATNPDALITVNYTSDVTNIDSIINTKSSNSNVVKGGLLED